MFEVKKSCSRNSEVTFKNIFNKMSSSSRDSYDYERYDLGWYEENEGPPLIKKRSRLIAAVVHDEVDVLSDLLDSPKWYNVKDKWGYNLLQIAILQEKRRVFDYLLSLPDVPLEWVNEDGQTALMVALTGFVSNDIPVGKHYAFELIKKGACVDKIISEGNSLLFQALDRNFFKVAKLIIEKGVDVNFYNDNDGNGCTALQHVDFWGTNHNDFVEVFIMLLMYGADPCVQLNNYVMFEYGVIRDFPYVVQEALFYYTYDQNSTFEIHLDVLLKLFSTNSPLLSEVMNLSFEVVLNEGQAITCFNALCSMDSENLKMVLDKYECMIGQVLLMANHQNYDVQGSFKYSIESLNVLLESGLKPYIADFINRLTSVVEGVLMLVTTESEFTEYLCFLLSYGLEIYESDLYIIFKKFGYCELFKILLHMDIITVDRYYYKYEQVIPLFIYNVTIDPQKFIENSSNMSSKEAIELAAYFCHPKLNEICDQEEDTELQKINLPQIPLLVELARNAFRKFFVEKFYIKTSRTFYTLLNCLPISTVYKNIITYESKLYS